MDRFDDFEIEIKMINTKDGKSTITVSPRGASDPKFIVAGNVVNHRTVDQDDFVKHMAEAKCIQFSANGHEYTLTHDSLKAFKLMNAIFHSEPKRKKLDRSCAKSGDLSEGLPVSIVYNAIF